MELIRSDCLEFHLKNRMRGGGTQEMEKIGKERVSVKMELRANGKGKERGKRCVDMEMKWRDKGRGGEREGKWRGMGEEGQ